MQVTNIGRIEREFIGTWSYSSKYCVFGNAMDNLSYNKLTIIDVDNNTMMELRIKPQGIEKLAVSDTGDIFIKGEKTILIKKDVGYLSTEYQMDTSIPEFVNNSYPTWQANLYDKDVGESRYSKFGSSGFDYGFHWFGNNTYVRTLLNYPYTRGDFNIICYNKTTDSLDVLWEN